MADLHREFAVAPAVGSFAEDQHRFYAAVAHAGAAHVPYVNFVLKCIEEVLQNEEVLGFPLKCIRLPAQISSGQNYRIQAKKWCKDAVLGVVILDGLRPNVTYEMGLMDAYNQPVLYVMTIGARISIKSLYPRDMAACLAVAELSARQWNHLGEPLLGVNEHLSDFAGAHVAIAPNPNVDEVAFKRALVGELTKMRPAILGGPNLKGEIAKLEAESVLLRKSEKFQEALNIYDKLILLDPKYCDYHVRRGICLSELGHYKESLQALDQALVVHSNCPAAYVNRSVVHQRNGDTEAAIRDAKKTLEADSSYASGYSQMAFLFFKRGEYESAISSAEKATNLQSSLSQAWRVWIDCLLKSKNLDKALEVSERYVRLDPKKGLPYALRGMVFYERKEPTKALASLKEASKLAEKDKGVWRQIGVIQSDAGNYSKALVAFQKAITVDSLDSHTWFHVGLEHFHLGNHKKSLAAFENVQASELQLPSTLAMRAFNKLNLGDFEGALIDAKRAVELKPRGNKGTYAMALAFCRQCNKALDFDKQNSSELPQHPETQLESAVVQKLCGKENIAEVLLTKLKTHARWKQLSCEYSGILKHANLSN